MSDCDYSTIWALDIPPAQKLVLVALHNAPDATAADVAAKTGYCERQAKAILYKLAGDRRVTTQRQNGKPTTYRSIYATYAEIAQGEQTACEEIAQQEEPAYAKTAQPEPELSNARTHAYDVQAREESLSLVNYLGESPEKKKEKDSGAKKTRRASPSVSKPKPAIREIPDSLRPRFEIIGKLTDTSLNSPTIWDYHHFFSGTISANRKTTDWYKFQIVGGLTDDALREFTAYEKRQFVVSGRSGKFCLRTLAVLNNKVNQWLEKRAAQDADRQQRAAYASMSMGAQVLA